MSKVSIKDVANAAGVSVSSVSFFMNRPERLSQASRDHIGEICKKLGYAPGKKPQRSETRTPFTLQNP